MGKWALFLMSIGSLFIILYPVTGEKIIMILQGLVLIVIGGVIFIKSKKR